MAAKNRLANKSLSKKKIEEIKAHTTPLKAKEGTVYMVLTYFRKTKAPFRCLKQFIWQFKTGK
jgi:hypothetical protein